jgi:putative flippase GtrA
MTTMLAMGKRIWVSHGGRFVGFLAAGLPSFILAVPINYALVTYAEMPKPIAYALVLVLQVSVNFVMCRCFVFKERHDRSITVQFVQFLGSILAFRLLDWGLYAFAVDVLGVHFILMQLFNVGLFAVLKYWISSRILSR